MQAIPWTVWRGKHCDTFQIRGRCDPEDHRKTDCRAVRGQDAEAGSIFDSAEAAGAVKPPENKQIEREEEIAKRSRYYHTSRARQGLKKGQPYRMLKSNYVIFVCCYDAFDMDAPIYRFEMFDNNLQLKLGDGSSRIILNTKCSKEKIPQELMAFYDFVDTGRVDASDTFVKYLDTRVEEANNDEEVDRIMTLEEEMIVRYDSGLQKGRAEGATLKQREIAQNLKNAGIPIPVIAETTGLTQEEVEML